MRRTVFGLLLATAVTACGEVQPRDQDTGDDVDVDAGDEIDSHDDPVALVSTAPAASGLTADVVTTIALTFSGELDAGSFDDAIQVFERESRRPVPIREVGWEAETRTLTATLARPLNYGWKYRVEVDGLTAGGIAVPVEPYRFRTRINQPERSRGYGASPIGGGFVVNSRTDDVLTADGGFDRRVNYAAGPDGLYDTGDDVISSWYDYTYTDEGTSLGHTGHNARGGDGAWFTADDVIVSYGTAQYGDAGMHRVQGFTDPGADRVWKTDDDVASYFQEYSYDSEDREIRFTSYASAGVDGVRYTADDVVGSVQVSTYQAAGSTQISYSAAGADGVWLTGDDTVASRNEYQIDDAGRTTEFHRVNANDTIAYYTRAIYDPTTGLLLRTLRWTGAGTDATWFTADDVLTSYTDTSYDAQHRRVRQSQRDLGPNGFGPDGDDRETQATFQFDPLR